MITFKEVLGHISINDVSIKEQQNIDELLKSVNIVLAAYDAHLGRHWPAHVTSGYRTLQDHLRIYAAKGIFDKAKIPMASRHLTGNAVDILDEALGLTKWLQTPEGAIVLDKANLFCESGNKNWWHAQRLPFASYKPGGTRWFKP